MTGILDGAPLPGPAATRNLDPPEVAVAVGAHPDDIEFHAGATLARWSAAGTLVHLVICTDGSKGSWDPGTNPGSLAGVRRCEAEAAAGKLGCVGEVVHLGAVDGELADTPGLHDALVGELRRLRPGVVLGHDPWRRYRLHPDHRAAGWLVVDACVAARDPHFLGHLGAAHRPGWLMLFEADEPDHVEETGGFLDTKVAALLAHTSQWESTMGISDGNDAAATGRFATHITEAATRVGDAAGCGPAESFRRLGL
jgi:LmbE family N-acetylglucosaminyl deacetylase